MPEYPLILFLDFDGVLHPVGGAEPRRRMEKLPLLETLLREPACADVGVVISSTWRVLYNTAQLRSGFSPDVREHIVDCTPELEEHHTPFRRHEEIAAWLDAHPQVRGWVALDDDVRGFPPQVYSHAVFTQSAAGLTPRDVDLLRVRLGEARAGSQGR
ncbi:MAG TPA: HAD domain-containing protein [Burkholderiales bacterium]|jgi:hypothetical protein